jgi:hypothetical protein
MPPLYRVVALAFLCFACPKQKDTPPFCDQDLSGVWLNSSDTHFAYRLRDHGGIIRGEYMERADDGGLAAPDEPMLFELHRFDGGVAGVMKTTGQSPGGRACPVEYGFEVTVCNPGAMQARVETSVHITDDCKRYVLPDGGEAPSELGEFRLQRAPPSSGGDQPVAH